jgi:hypothetical protein
MVPAASSARLDTATLAITRRGIVSEMPDWLWDIVIRVAVEVAEETEAQSIVDRLIGKMGITLVGPPAYRRFDDGTWVAEMNVDTPRFEEDEPDGALSIVSTLGANLGPVTWRSSTDMPSVPDSATAAKIEWPPGYWALLGRRETLVHPSVRAMQLQARRTEAPGVGSHHP